MEEKRDAVVMWLWLTAQLREWPLAILEDAISSASLATAKQMWATRLLPMRVSLDSAAYRGDMAFLEWAGEQGAEATEQTSSRCRAKYTVKWVCENYPGLCTPAVMDVAAQVGNLDILAFFGATTRSRARLAPLS